MTAREDLPPAVFLMGPTASGKTDLAVALASRLPLEIISVDSALVYRGMDIGTAKPDAETLARAPHRLIDICDPGEAYSVGRFRDDALREMADITSRGQIPLLAGGTMLYFRGLEKGIAQMPRGHRGLRQRLSEEAAHLGLEALHDRLRTIDPESASRIHPNDPQRILRALEVYELTGRPLSAWHGEAGEVRLPYRVLKLILAPADRAVLRARIAERFHRMLENGFEEEVRHLLARGDLDPDLPALRAVGYRQMIQYLLGNLDRDSMIQQAIDATRQLAKRQMTWLRREASATWLLQGAAGRDQAVRLAAEFIERK